MLDLLLICVIPSRRDASHLKPQLPPSFHSPPRKDEEEEAGGDAERGQEWSVALEDTAKLSGTDTVGDIMGGDDETALWVMDV